MKSIILATSINFWHNDRGDRSRIHNLYKFLVKSGFRVPVFYTGELSMKDSTCLKDIFPELELHIPDLPLRAPESEQDYITPNLYRQTRVWLKTNFPKPVVRLIQVTQAILRRSIKYMDLIFLKAISIPQEPTLSQLENPMAAKSFAELCGRLKPDAVIIQYIHQAYLVNQLHDHATGGPFRILDTLDVMHLRTKQFHTHGERHWAAINYDEEKDILNRFDIILAIQKNDAQELSRMAPKITILTVGHSLPVVPINRVHKTPVQITYFGTGAAPNRHALNSFLKYVWKPVSKQMKGNAQLHIAGSICDTLSSKRRHKNVVIRGYINDVTELYSQSDIVVNPVIFGGGLKIKTVEALCHCSPLLTTSKGMEGLKLTEPLPCLICDEWPDMIKALLILIQHPETRDELSRISRSYAQDNFSEESTYGPLRDCIRSLSINSES